MNPPVSPAIDSLNPQPTTTRYMQTYEVLLKKWPVASDSLLLPTRLGVTHVIASGAVDAAPLLLLPGMCATALVWRANVEELSRYFRVYAVDVIGQGGKSRATARLGKRSDYATWLCDLFDALNIDKAALVGNSYGAFLALNQASLTPQRVSGAVLINPAGVFVSILPLALPFLWHRLKLALRPGARRKPHNIASYLGRNVSLRPDEQEWADLVVLRAPDRMQRNLAFPSVFSTAELHAIDVPTLLLMGDNDLLYDPIATSSKAKQRMPSLNIHILQGAHHIAAMAKPAEANAEIIHFLQKCGIG